jgi:hypothetical protein
MRQTVFIACLVVLPLLAGCTVSDALLTVFGDGYTGGGYTRADKEYHADQQVQAYRDYESRNP